MKEKIKAIRKSEIAKDRMYNNFATTETSYTNI